MAKSLLERQTSLVEFVTSGTAIFGKAGDQPVTADLPGIDRAPLHIEARLAHAKRMQKILAVLPKTFALLGSGKGRIVRVFAEMCPATSISRLENARQFLRFLSTRLEELAPSYIGDVAACEIGLAAVYNDGGPTEGQPNPGFRDGWRGAIRRSPAAQLLRCAYDIRAIFETQVEPTSDQAEPIRRDVRLVIAVAPDTGRPHVLEVVPSIFDLLAALDAWVDLPDGTGSATLIANLARSGLIEVHP